MKSMEFFLPASSNGLVFALFFYVLVLIVRIYLSQILWMSEF
jgi:hypothetical protein